MCTTERDSVALNNRVVANKISLLKDKLRIRFCNF